MKKIININLSGRVIPIEDSAYEKLQGYIESLRRYFAKEDGRDEIINDIESRIAELMNDKTRLGSSAITDADVSEIIASMGTIEDFEAVDSDNASAGQAGAFRADSNTSSSYTRKEKSRLYRDSSDKMIGGVCAGIANYINIDPAIVRILFGIITFGGFGLGFLVYILLWIILPPRDLVNYSGKRLYRNPDDKVISGVAGGLAAYFDKSPNMIRLIFAAPLLLNIIFGVLSWPFFHEGSFVPNIVFGSLTGTFILAYIVLWIVLPEANSQYQKMEMRGEKVDVNSIRQNVKEGMENMKGRMKDWSNEVKESAENLGSKAKEFAGTRGKAFAAEAGEAARRTGRGLGHIIGVLFKAFFLFIAGSIAFALFIGLIGLLIGGIGVWPLTNFILDGFWQNTFAWGTVILFLGVPLIGFITWLLRRIMKVRSHNNYLGWTFAGLWTLGWISASLFAASLVNDFKMSNYRRPATELAITEPINGKMTVLVSEPEVEYSGTMPWIDIDGNGFDITKDTLRIANIRIDDVEKSVDDKFHVTIKKYSKGRTTIDAESRAQKIQFSATYRDSILDLGSSIAIDKDTKFRGQQVIVSIQVPVGKKIRFDETIHRLHAFDIEVRERRSWNGRRNWDIDADDDFGYRTNVDYTMNADGILRDTAGAAATQPVRDYRYIDNDSLDLLQLERIKNRAKDLEEKIKARKNKPQSQIRNEKMQPREATGSGPNPGVTLMDWF